jgi:hypothetical protein
MTDWQQGYIGNPDAPTTEPAEYTQVIEPLHIEHPKVVSLDMYRSLRVTLAKLPPDWEYDD